MTELLTAIARGLVDDPDSVRVERDEPDSDGVVVYHLHVAERINEKIMVEID